MHALLTYEGSNSWSEQIHQRYDLHVKVREVWVYPGLRRCQGAAGLTLYKCIQDAIKQRLSRGMHACIRQKAARRVVFARHLGVQYSFFRISKQHALEFVVVPKRPQGETD
jgi:hypothetical protein